MKQNSLAIEQKGAPSLQVNTPAAGAPRPPPPPSAVIQSSPGFSGTRTMNPQCRSWGVSLTSEQGMFTTSL